DAAGCAAMAPRRGRPQHGNRADSARHRGASACVRLPRFERGYCAPSALLRWHDGAVAFGWRPPARMDAPINPLLAPWEGPFGLPPFDLIRPEHFKPAFERGMREHRDELARIV